MSLETLKGLWRAAMLAALATAGKVKPTRTRKPQRHFGYPSRSFAHSIAHYDAAIRTWIDSGREGPKPIRRVEPKKVAA